MNRDDIEQSYRDHPGLRAAVEHAERALTILARMSEDCIAIRRSQPIAHAISQTEKWLYGRPSEIRIVIDFTLEDWRAGKTSGDAAARALRDYVDERVHRGLETELGTKTFPCCVDEVTVVCTDDTLETREYRIGHVLSHSAPTRSMTLPTQTEPAVPSQTKIQECAPTLESSLGPVPVPTPSRRAKRRART
jgi:hypothetical protein